MGWRDAQCLTHKWANRVREEGGESGASRPDILRRAIAKDRDHHSMATVHVLLSKEKHK